MMRRTLSLGVPTSRSKHFTPIRTTFATRCKFNLHNAASRKLRYASSTSSSDQLNVVMDMDECMIHSLALNPMTGGIAVPRTAPSLEHFRKDLDSLTKFIATMPDGDKVLVLQRPHLMRYLEQIASKYRVSVYTAGTQEYADAVLDAIDPSGELFKGGRFYRDSCLLHSRLHLKDVRICLPSQNPAQVEEKNIFMKNTAPIPTLETRETDSSDLSRVVLVDNSSISMIMHPTNGIPVQAWYHDATDDIFDTDILSLLERLDGEPDVRPVLQSLYDNHPQMTEAQRIRSILFEQDSAASQPSIKAQHDLDVESPNYSRDRASKDNKNDS